MGQAEKFAIDQEELKEICVPIVRCMNLLQANGVSIDKVLLGMLYMVGVTIKAMNADLTGNETINEFFPVIMAGFDAGSRTDKANAFNTAAEFKAGYAGQ